MLTFHRHWWRIVAIKFFSPYGAPLKNLTHYRVTSKPFDVYFPPNNVWGVPVGTTRSVADTYIIFLKPLSEGNHVFKFKASSPANPLVGSTSRHALEVKYNLIVGKDSTKACKFISNFFKAQIVKHRNYKFPRVS
jgi:hypothetical protein